MRKLMYIIFLLTVFYSGYACDSEETSGRSSDGTESSCEAGSCMNDCELGFVRRLDECVVDTESDQDFDGVPNEVDNCPMVSNASQADCDQDGQGDECDTESVCGMRVSGYVSKYDHLIDLDQALVNGLIEVVGYPVYTNTDMTGQYSMGGLNPGDYSVLIYNMNRDVEEAPNAIARFPLKVVSSSLGTQAQDWIIDPPGHIMGSAKFADKPTVEGVHSGIGVYVKDIPFKTAVTTYGGHFELRNIPAGPQTLVFVYPEYEPVEVEVEVVGLATIAVTPDKNGTSLPMHMGDETWSHEIEIILSGLTESTEGSLNLTLRPLFPHITDPVELVLTGETEEETLVLRERIVHQLHDVFHVSVTDQVKRSNAYNLSGLNDGELRQTRLFTEGLPAEWEDYSERLNNQALTIEELQPAAEPQEMIDYPFVSPLIIKGEFNDEFTVYSVNHREATVTNAQSRQSPWRYPLSYQHKEMMLSLTSSAEIVFDQAQSMPTPIAEEATYEIDFGLRSVQARESIQLALASEPCWPGSDCDFALQEISLNDCTTDNGSDSRCSVAITLPRTHSQLRIWVYENVEEIPTLFEGGCTLQCLNHFGVDALFGPQLGLSQYPVPIYPMFARAMSAVQEQDCSVEGSFNLHTSEVSRPEFCFPNLPNHYPSDQRNACLSQPVYGQSGRPFMIQAINISSTYGSETLGEFASSPDIRGDLNGLNPLVIYDFNRCAFCSGGFFANRTLIDLKLTDGVTTVDSFRIITRHESESQNDIPYCWSFAYDPNYDLFGK